MSQILLIPVDGSQQAKKALMFAVDWAQHHQSVIHLLNVPDLPSASELAFVDTYSIDVSQSIERLEAMGQDIVAEAIATARKAGIKEVTGTVAVGNPAQQILAQAEQLDATMIVMGSRGMGELRSLLVGSVSHKVMQHASCTTVVVR